MIKQSEDEIWKPIPGYEGLYEASNFGRIRSLPRATTSGRLIKQYCNPRNGYMYISTSKGNIRKSCRVHRLVMNAFYGKHEDMQVNHIDGDKTNNCLNNLEWCTQSQNMRHAYETGLEVPKGKEVIDLTTGFIYKTMTDAARSVGGHKASAITRVCNGNRSQYRDHRFAYLDDYENGTIPEFKGKFRKRTSKKQWR